MGRKKLVPGLIAGVVFTILIGSGLEARELVVRGSVLDAEGSVPPHAKILLFSSEAGRDPVVEQPVEADGRFEVTVPGEGLWRVRAMATGARPAQLDLYALFEDVDLPTVWLEPARASQGRSPAARPMDPFSWYPLPEDTRPASPRASPTEPEPVDGQVVESETRQGISGVLVWRENEPGTWTRTDEQGGFWLGGSGAIRVDAPGYAPVLVPVLVETTPERTPGRDQSPLLVELRPTVAVRGIVRSSEGQVVPGIQLEIRKEFSRSQTRHGLPVPPIRWSLEPHTGTFHLRKLVPAESYELSLRAPGFAPLVHVWSPPSDPREDHFELALTAGNRVEGEIVTVSGSPIGQAEVLAIRSADPVERRRVAVGDLVESAPIATAESATDGSFYLSELPSGPLDLIVRKEGFAPATRVGLRVPQETRRLTLEPIALRPTLDVEGRVIDVEGESIEGAELFVAWRVETPGGGGGEFASGIGEPVAITDPEGSFTLHDLEAEQPFILVIRRQGFLQRRIEGLVAPFDPPSLTITLLAGARIEGQVLGRDRRPLPGAAIEVRPGGGRSLLEFLTLYGDELSAETGSDGRFAVRGLPIGTYDVHARATSHQPQTVENVLVTRDTEAVELALTLEPGVVVQGTAEASDGRPVEGALVQAAGVQAQTDPEGHFALDGVPQGRVRLRATHPARGRAAEEVTVGPGGAYARLVFQPAGRIRGVVLDEVSRPVAGALVRLLPQGGPQRRLRTGEDGRFTFLDVAAPSRVLLVAEGAGYVEARETLGVEAGSEQRATLFLSPACHVRGRVVGLAADELRTASLHANQPGGTSIAGSLGYQGDYRVEGLRDGSWTLVVRTASGHQGRAVFECRAGAREHLVDLELDEGHPLAVTVALNGRRLPGADVLLRDEAGVAVGGGRTSHRGTFEATGLASGRVRVTARYAEWGLEAGREVTLPAVDSTEIVLVQYEVSGLISDAESGLPLENVRIRLASESGSIADAKLTETNSEGRFYFAAAAPGQYTLAVERHGYEGQRFRLELGGEQTRKALAVAMSRTPPP